MYIKELLLMHDCVIIPQFGGFVSNYKPAYYDKKTGRFYPPSKEISFNSKLTHNDGLLCQQLMKNEGLTFNGAIERIQVEVKKTNLQLENKSVTIDGLGVFKKNANGFVIFDADKDAKLLKKAYGLASFVFPELITEERSTHLRVIKSEKSLKNQYKSISRYVAVAAAAVTLFFFLFPAAVNDVRLNEANIIASFDSLNKDCGKEATKELIVENNEALLNEAVTEPTTTVESVSETIVDLAEPKIDKQTTKILQVVSATQYHIIIASLATKAQAEAFVKKHCVGIYPEYSIIQSNGRYRVSINALTDKSIAIPVLETFRDANPKFSDAWLLTIKATV